MRWAGHVACKGEGKGVQAGYFLTSWVTISFSNNIPHHTVME
jgi:hypothetical protein